MATRSSNFRDTATASVTVMTTMTAALYRTYGLAADVMSIEQVERPEPGPGEVRVRVSVSALNPTDVKTRSGSTPRPIDDFQVPHMDGAGVIDAVGAGVDPLRIGERVWLMLSALGNRWGTAAQWSVVPSSRAIALPDGVSMDIGATLGVPAVTAAHCLFARGSITGKDVLIAGGAGAVGRAAIHLARWAGARVCATVSGAQKADIARAAGAHHTVNYREAGAAEQLAAWSPRFDRIVELALGPNLELDLSVSGQGTSIVTYAIDDDDPILPIRRCMITGITLDFMLLYTLSASALADAVHIVDRAVGAGALDLPPVTRFELQDVVAAHQAQEAGPIGKVLIDVP